MPLTDEPTTLLVVDDEEAIRSALTTARAYQERILVFLDDARV